MFIPVGKLFEAGYVILRNRFITVSVLNTWAGAGVVGLCISKTVSGKSVRFILWRKSFAILVRLPRRSWRTHRKSRINSQNYRHDRQSKNQEHYFSHKITS